MSEDDRIDPRVQAWLAELTQAVLAIGENALPTNQANADAIKAALKKLRSFTDAQ